MNIVKQLRIYNSINIIATITLLTVQVLNFTIWSDFWSLLLTDDQAIILILPIELLVVIVILNKRILKSFIHYSNRIAYEANNVIIDDYKDKGTIPETAIKALPTSAIAGCESTTTADMIFYGKLDDIKIKYEANKFGITLSFGSGRSKKYAYSLTGIALVTEIEQSNFDNDWTMFLNSHVKIKQPVYSQDRQETIISGDSEGLLLYQNEVDPQTIGLIKRIIAQNLDIFESNQDVIALFKENQFILITPDNNYKLKIPYIVPVAKYNQLVLDQKEKVYRFNKLLVAISRITNIEGENDASTEN